MRVFSKEKFLKDEDCRKFYDEIIYPWIGENNWVNKFNGKTEKEIRDAGYTPIEQGMIEK